MTSRERFWRELAAVHDPDDLNKHAIELAWSLWQAAERQALERALATVNHEHLCDPTDSEDDIAYEMAILDCEYAIRQLIEQSASKEKR